MSFRRNIAASYASQLYVTLVSIAILPMYLKYMGEESYGLISFFSLLQSWFGLLDLGLTPTISRETARFHGGSLSAKEFRQLFRALASIFFTVALIGGAALYSGSDWIANRWLHFEHLPIFQVAVAVQIMAVSIALRWLGGLYRGVISGSEQLAWLSGFSALIATGRFLAVFVSMAVFGFTITVFFLHQLVIAIFEAGGLAWKTYHLLPDRKTAANDLSWSLGSVLPRLKFSMTIAFTSSVWIFVTQTDKLILSGILPMADYGYFSLAVLVAGGITLITSPISSALMPRLARLHAENDHEGFIAIYRQSTRLISVIAACATLALIICARPALIAWTGNVALADKAAPILQLYAAGNGLLSFGAFPFYLQYARGDLRYHLIGNAILIAILLPAVIICARSFGGIGAGLVWLCINTAYLLGWVTYVHHRLEPGLHGVWLLEDILQPLLPSAFLSGLMIWIPFKSTDRLTCLTFCLTVGATLVLPAIIAMRKLRRNSILATPIKAPASITITSDTDV